MKKVWAFIVLVVFSVQTSKLYAVDNMQNRRGNFSGRVVLADGQPIFNATVYLKSINKHTQTDDKGHFTISNIPYGNYDVSIHSIEIDDKSFQVRFNWQYKPTDFEVTSSVFMLDEAIITKKTKKRELETKGFSVAVVEPKEVVLQSIQTNELLDRTVGVRVRQEGGLGSRINYNINGMSGNAIKIFIDGVPASNFGRSFSLNSIPPSLIERIEVYKGVLPGNLSEDALGGAINIVMKQKAKNSLVSSYSFGSFNTHQWDVNGSLRKENGFTVLGSAFYNYSDNDYKVWGEDIVSKDYMGSLKSAGKVRRFHDAYESYGTNIRVGFSGVSWADRIFLGGVFSKNYKERQHGITMRNVYGDRHSRRQANVIRLNYEKSNLLLNGLSLKVDGSVSFNTRQAIDTVGIMYDWTGKPIQKPDGSFVEYVNGAEASRQKTAVKNKNTSYVVRANLEYAINQHHSFYINHLFNDFDRKYSDEFEQIALQKLRITRDLQKNIFSATYENSLFESKLKTSFFYKHYSQKVVSNEPRQVESAGGKIRYEVDKRVKEISFPGFGFTSSYSPINEVTILASAERTIRMPDENELFGNEAENLLDAITLEPEKSVNTNLGISLGTFYFKKHALRFNALVYYRNIKGMIREAMTLSTADYTQFENLDDVLSKGFDTEFFYTYDDRFSVSLSASKFDVLFNKEFNEQGVKYSYYKEQIRNEPSFKFSGNVSYTWNNFIQKDSKFHIYTDINYIGSFYKDWKNIGSENLAVIPSQSPVGFGFTYTLPSQKIVFGFTAKNIFDEQIFDNFRLQKPGRSFHGKITYYIF